MDISIKIEGLNQYYGRKQALKDVNLYIKTGMFGLLGRNGAGKTTLMKVLATLLKKSEGNVSICGIPVEDAREIRRIVGYLPQEFSMYPNMTVYEAMDYLGVLSGMDQKSRKQKIPKLLYKVNLQEDQKKKVKALSGGMKRRLGIAQAILHDPKILIVDEPTAGLDPEERVRFRNLLCEIAKDRIVILSTHIVGGYRGYLRGHRGAGRGEPDLPGNGGRVDQSGRRKGIYGGNQQERTGSVKGKIHGDQHAYPGE